MSAQYAKTGPKVSIITTVYNAVNTIEETILSVINQTYQNIEYIIVDGGSTDGTLSIIEKYSGSISKITSEKDNGIADGFNKGIALATGEWIGMINADDWYAPNAVELVMASLTAGCDVYCANLTLIAKDGAKRIKKSKVSWLNYGMYIMHPTCFVQNSVYQNVGKYNISYKIAMDFDMFLRIKRKGYKIKYINKNITYMRTCGVSGDVKKMHVEELAAMKKNLSGFVFLLSGLFNYLNRLRWRLFPIAS